MVETPGGQGLVPTSYLEILVDEGQIHECVKIAENYEASNVLIRATAEFDYVANDATEVSFIAGDALFILKRGTRYFSILS